jgi:hypothetical protein
MVSRASRASRHSTVSRANKAAASGEAQPAALSAVGTSVPHTLSQVKQSSSGDAAAAADALPAKPGSTSLSANEIIAACRQAKAAAQANARIRPATFVLPAGGPDEEAAPEQRMPQGKGRPQGGDASDGLARKQVRDAAPAGVGCQRQQPSSCLESALSCRQYSCGAHAQAYRDTGWS